MGFQEEKEQARQIYEKVNEQIDSCPEYSEAKKKDLKDFMEETFLEDWEEVEELQRDLRRVQASASGWVMVLVTYIAITVVLIFFYENLLGGNFWKTFPIGLVMGIGIWAVKKAVEVGVYRFLLHRDGLSDD